MALIDINGLFGVIASGLGCATSVEMLYSPGGSFGDDLGWRSDIR